LIPVNAGACTIGHRDTVTGFSATEGGAAMPTIIDDLQRDHRNMRALLDIVEEELDALRERRPVDFDLLGMIMEYTLNYPQMVHHPREDVLFRRLQKRDPNAAAAVGDLVEEHVTLAHLTQRFAAAIGNIARGVGLERERFDALARDYVARNRAHMQSEEHDFLPRALAALTDEDWAEIDASRAAGGDPIFGEKVAAAYERLFQRILKLHI
jgi:hemerythrin-like domain-containing protein